MGRMKEMWMDKQEQQADEDLAKKLGLTYSELMDSGFERDEDRSTDGLLYNYIITFPDDAPPEILSKVRGLDGNNMVWLPPWEFDNDEYYEEQYEAIISNKHYYDNFFIALDAARQLNKIDLGNKGLNDILRRQTYTSVIAALEAFLAETFVNLTNENPNYFRKFVETFHDFKERKFDLTEIFKEHDKIKETGKKAMLDVIYHHLPKVRGMYHETFGIDFPDIKDLYKFVLIRHDLVHRNGKTKEGVEVIVDSAAVEDLVNKAALFVEDIGKKLKIGGK